MGAVLSAAGAQFNNSKKIFILVRKDMDLNEHERLSNIILRHKLK